MKALITGASSGIGRDMARILSSNGYDLILVARRKDKLEALKKELQAEVSIICMDISSTFNCMKLYNKVKKENIDILINNAGFGLFGEFNSTNLDKELDMIDVNIKSLHTLTKLFLNDFVKKDSGYILNVASSAAFLPGPLMATYYATKAYVLRLTSSINEELRRNKSNVYIGVLCPGPVNTEFNSVAGVKFSIKSLESYDVAEYAIKKMLKKKRIIIPGISIKLGTFFTRFLPISLQARISYNIQKKKS
ncbi:MAG: SDR family oxidoreductase [Firmicutes bacterium]|nr:SDR family oxidoreductase [Bacillota bacterium]